MAYPVRNRRRRGTTYGGDADPRIPFAENGFTPDVVFDLKNYKFFGADRGLVKSTDFMAHAAANERTMTPANGNLSWGPHNFLVRSEEFENASWTKISGGTAANPTVTDNFALAPDGTLTATRVQAALGGGTSGADFALVRQGFASSIPEGDTTYGLFVKSNTGLNQTITMSYSGTPLTVAVTNSWQLLKVAPNVGGGNVHECDIGLRGDTTDQTADVLVWGAHLYRSDLGGMVDNPERGDSYVKTGATAVFLERDGNFIPGATVGRRLIEPPLRTNLVLRSAEFDNAVWSKNNITVTANAATAPDGTLTADKLVENTVSTFHTTAQDFSATSGVTYTQSYFVEKSERTFCVIEGQGLAFAGAPKAFFDLTNGVVGTTSGTEFVTASIEVTSVGYRISLTATASASSTAGLSLRLATDGSTTNYLGDGTSGIFVWGAQLEVSSVPSSYIPTTGSQVSRALETSEITEAALDREILAATGSSAMPVAVSGSMHALTSYADEGVAGQMTLYDWRVDVNNRITLTIDTDGAKTGTITLTMVNGGVSATVSTTVELTPGLNKSFKVAWRVTASDINIALNGTSETAVATAIGVPDLTSAAADLASTGDVINKAEDRYWFTNIADAGLSGATS